MSTTAEREFVEECVHAAGIIYRGTDEPREDVIELMLNYRKSLLVRLAEEAEREMIVHTCDDTARETLMPKWGCTMMTRMTMSSFTQAAETLPSPVSGRGPVGSSPVYANF